MYHCHALLSQTVVLVGDIGGTNCRLVLERIVDGQSDEILFQKVQPSRMEMLQWNLLLPLMVGLQQQAPEFWFTHTGVPNRGLRHLRGCS
jgi:hypothetical protein